MGRIQAVATAEPQARSPERQKLADAIENLAKAKAALAHIRDVIGFQVDKGLDADRTLREDMERLEELGADDARALAAQALGDDAGSRTLRDARDAVEAARRNAELVEVTLRGLRQGEEEAELVVSSAETSLKTAHLAALSVDPAVAALVTRFKGIKQSLYDLLQVVELTRAFHGYSFHPLDPPRVLDTSELTRWKAAIEALRSDADAELP